MRFGSFGSLIRGLCSVIILAGSWSTALAVPASKALTQITQPDGTRLSVYKRGDEYSHTTTTVDGYTLRADSLGIYRFAVINEKGDLVPGPHVASDPENRRPEVTTFLKSIQPGLRYSAGQRTAGLAKRLNLRTKTPTALRSASTLNTSNLLINDFPLEGTVKALVILVNFSDVAFTTTSTYTAFNNLLNQSGYSESTHIGSVKDYYMYNSDSSFTPDFKLVGPITLTNTVAYYGGVNKDGDDIRPREMVREACQAVDGQVDFSEYDVNNDGIVENVYVVYAGKGEADGGDATTIWPHSYSLTGSYSLTLDGKKIVRYACSAELDGTGKTTGIGDITHEFGHILGLPDFYDVDGSDNGEAFDLDAWSLMAYGSYNANGTVPPSLTLLERYLLGWTTPIELQQPVSPILPPLVTSNKGFIVHTANSNEFFLLENRQQIKDTWDQYIPYHGMLVYHVDARNDASITFNYYGNTQTWTFEDLWQGNMVNAIASHNCADIEEADKAGTLYTGSNSVAYVNGLKGDPFPGSTGKTTFTDNTQPAMKAWSGLNTEKPITSITELVGGDVRFLFMGGKSFLPSPEMLQPEFVYPFSFSATWQSVEDVTGYRLTVSYLDTSSGDSVAVSLPDYTNVLLTDTNLVVYVPNDNTTYHYQVTATNDFIDSSPSATQTVTTPYFKPVVKTASDLHFLHFKANWKAEPWATGYYLTVFEVDTVFGTDTVMNPLPAYTNILTTDTSFLIEDTDNDRAYSYTIRVTDSQAISRSSDLMTLTTPSASDIYVYYRDGYVYIKGIDAGSTITLYGQDGRIRQTSNSPVFKALQKGLFIAKAMFKNRQRFVKVLVQ